MIIDFNSYDQHYERTSPDVNLHILVLKEEVRLVHVIIVWKRQIHPTESSLFQRFPAIRD